MSNQENMTKEEFEKLQQKHRDAAVDEIIDFEANKKKQTFEKFQKSATKTFAHTSKTDIAAGKKPYNIILSFQFLFILLAMCILFGAVIWSTTTLTEPYYYVVFITKLIAFLGFAVIVYYYLDGFKRGDKLILVPMISTSVCIAGSMYTNWDSTIVETLPWLNYMMFVALLLSIVPCFVVDKTYLCIGCFSLVSILATISAVCVTVFASIPYFIEYSVELPMMILYFGIVWSTPVLCFSLQLCYIENTKRKVIGVTYEKWIERDDGKFWKFQT